MKKTYIFPKEIIIDLNGEEMLALSGDITNIGGEGSGEDARTSSETSSSKNSLWDAEW